MSEIDPITGATCAEGYCKDSADGTHCEHWWDDDGPCCRCSDDTPSMFSDARRRP